MGVEVVVVYKTAGSGSKCRCWTSQPSHDEEEEGVYDTAESERVI